MLFITPLWHRLASEHSVFALVVGKSFEIFIFKIGFFLYFRRVQVVQVIGSTNTVYYAVLLIVFFCFILLINSREMFATRFTYFIHTLLYVRKIIKY